MEWENVKLTLKALNRYKKTGSVQNHPKTGRKRKTTARQDRQMVILSKKDPFMTAP